MTHRLLHRRLAVVLMLALSLLPAVDGPSVSASMQDAAAAVDNSNPIVSPNGQQIVFVTQRLAKSEIAVMNVDGTDPRRLTTTPLGDSDSPSWSPDGQRIAYVSGVAIRAQIHTMNRDGSDQRRLTDDGKNDCPRWSPDGRRIAFVSDHDLYVVNANGGGRVRVTSDQSVADVSWSPDSSRLVFGTSIYVPGMAVVLQERASGRIIVIVGPGGRAETIDVISPNGSGRRTLSAARDRDPSWSPDGRWILFASEREGDPRIYVMNADGSNVVRLTKEGTNLDPVWARDGQRIAFVSRRGSSRQIHTVNADGSGEIQLTREGSNSSPSWSPDGRWIAFASSRDGRTQIFVVNADGSGERQLTKEQGP